MSKDTKNRPFPCLEDQRSRVALHDRDSSPDAMGPCDFRPGRQPKPYRERLLSNLHYRMPASGPGSRSVLSVHFRTTHANRVPLIPDSVLSIRVQEFYRDMAWDDRVDRPNVFRRFRAFFSRMAGWVKSRFFPFPPDGEMLSPPMDMIRPRSQGRREPVCPERTNDPGECDG